MSRCMYEAISDRSFDRSTPSGIGDCCGSAPIRLGEESTFCHSHFDCTVMLTQGIFAKPRGQRWKITVGLYADLSKLDTETHTANNSVRIYI